MPSGAKRRKAAKKKKEQETQNGNPSSSNPEGDEREGSDAKEWGPVARAKSVERDSSDAEGVRKDGGESSDAETVRRDSGARIEGGSKEGSGSKKHAGSGKESSKSLSSSSSSSSSSSDDESRVVDRRRNEKGDATVSEEKPATPASDLVKSVDSLLAEVTHPTGAAPADKTTGLVAEKPVATHSTADELTEKSTSLATEKAPSLDSNRPVVTGDAPAQKITSSVAEKAPSFDPEKPVMTVHFSETTPIDGIVISGTVVKPVLESGAEKMLPTGTAETMVDSLPVKIESIVPPVPVENGKSSSSVAESVSNENGSKVLPSLGATPAQTSNDARSIKDSDIPEYSESQPLVAPAPRVVEKTSCFGCCGILEVIGSRR